MGTVSALPGSIHILLGFQDRQPGLNASKLSRDVIGLAARGDQPGFGGSLATQAPSDEPPDLLAAIDHPWATTLLEQWRRHDSTRIDRTYLGSIDGWRLRG